jgi:hypothetical protein
VKSIKEYLLDCTAVEPQIIYIPCGAEVVGINNTDCGLMLIVIVDTLETGSELRTFKVCSKNETIYKETLKYIGVFESNIGTKYVVEFK